MSVPVLVDAFGVFGHLPTGHRLDPLALAAHGRPPFHRGGMDRDGKTISPGDH